jgi:hypothetical protein
MAVAGTAVVTGVKNLSKRMVASYIFDWIIILYVLQILHFIFLLKTDLFSEQQQVLVAPFPK